MCAMWGPNPASRPAAARPSDAGYAMAYFMTRWAAIAYSNTTGRFGYSFMQNDQASAEQRARAECGAPDAFIAVSGANLCYQALATASDRGWGSGFAGDAAAARREALANCPGASARLAVVIHPTKGVEFLRQDAPSGVGAAAPAGVLSPRLHYFQPGERRIALRWGAICGAIAALAVLAAFALASLWGLLFTTTTSPRSLLIEGLVYLVAPLCLLSGALAARATGPPRAAALAGAVTGVIWTLPVVAEIAYEQAVLTPSHDSQGVLILTYLIGWLVVAVVAGLIAAGLGALGGLAGRRRVAGR